ncbi:MAG TPA: DegT/DnrJ/EryC1/StrS family aminotransferase [Acidimicrobiales bacterium]|jgi:dTDP-4-amino-4,6-dideoxygalactose transaminase|nr:DegT/DnrJ/EryC1/StrS family aminotransferase [Acidimicrobiales bacterium]
MSTERAPEPSVGFAVPHIIDADVEAVARVLRSGWLSTGSECHGLEADLAERVGAPHVIAMSSCTAALEIAVASLRLPPGARVAVPTWTFVASASSVVHAGAVPVLLDVEPDTLNISPDAVEAAIAEGIDALMVVHFAGTPVDRAVLDLAAEAGVPVIEDAAHALGASDHRGPISGVGTVGACLSFYATKNLTSAEGGALITHDDELAAYARSQRLHGLSHDAWDRYRVGANPEYDVREPGLKANLPDVLAVLARSQLERFDEMQTRRREVVSRYRSAVEQFPGCTVVPGEADPGSADHLFVLLLPEGTDRTEVTAAMTAAGIGTSVHFRPVHTFSWFREHAPIGPTGVGTADRLAGRALSLPLHAGLTDGEVERVIDALAGALS